MLASQMAMPREGHLAAVHQIFAYLDQHHNLRLVFDPCYPIHNEANFIKCDWTDMYGDIKEAISTNAPVPQGWEVELQMYVDADHAGDQLIRRSWSGFIIYLNSAPKVWQSKKQATVETSVFGG